MVAAVVVVVTAAAEHESSMNDLCVWLRYGHDGFGSFNCYVSTPVHYGACLLLLLLLLLGFAFQIVDRFELWFIEKILVVQ